MDLHKAPGLEHTFLVSAERRGGPFCASTSAGGGCGSTSSSTTPGPTGSADSVGSLLIFDSNFECGNLAAASLAFPKRSIVGEVPLYELVLEEDTNSAGNTQWFFFSVRNGKKGQTVNFSLINMGKSASLFGGSSGEGGSAGAATSNAGGGAPSPGGGGCRPLCFSWKKAIRLAAARRAEEQERTAAAAREREEAEQKKMLRSFSNQAKRFRAERVRAKAEEEREEDELAGTAGAGSIPGMAAPASQGASSSSTRPASIDDDDPLPGWHRCGSHIRYEPSRLTKTQLRRRLRGLKLGDFISGDKMIAEDLLWMFATPSSNMQGQPLPEGLDEMDPEEADHFISKGGISTSTSQPTGKQLYRLKFRYTFEEDDDVVYFAYSYPYSFTRLERLLAGLDTTHSYTNMLCRTLK